MVEVKQGDPRSVATKGGSGGGVSLDSHNTSNRTRPELVLICILVCVMWGPEGWRRDERARPRPFVVAFRPHNLTEGFSSIGRVSAVGQKSQESPEKSKGGGGFFCRWFLRLAPRLLHNRE